MIINEKNYADVAEQVILRLKERAKNGSTGQQNNNYKNSNYRNNGYKNSNNRSNNQMRSSEIKPISTSQIRNILAMSSEIYNEIILQQGDRLSDEMMGRIDYLRVRCTYAAGRDEKSVKPFMEETQIIKILKEINGSRKNFIIFNRYLESLVAFHRYYGGKDI